jgi:N-carbamoylputrescine amidase
VRSNRRRRLRLRRRHPVLGPTFIAEPSGQLIHRAGVEKEEVIVKHLDLEKVESARTHWPFLRDRRIDAYGGLVKRFADQTS